MNKCKSALKLILEYLNKWKVVRLMISTAIFMFLIAPALLLILWGIDHFHSQDLIASIFMSIFGK